MFGFNMKNMMSLLGGDINKMVKSNIDKHYSETMTGILQYFYSRYPAHDKDRLAVLLLPAGDDSLIYFVVTVDGSMSVSEILEQGNVYDLLMSIDYQKLIDEMKKAQKSGDNGK